MDGMIKDRQRLRRRIGMSLAGVAICGIAVGFFKKAAFGVDPFQTLMSGLNAVIPIAFGTLYMAASGVLLLFSLAANRKCIGVSTFINLFLPGYIAQGTQALLDRLFPDPSFGMRSFLLAFGIVIMCLSSAFYMVADLVVSVYDAVAITIAEKWKVWQFRYVRICTDLFCVTAGVAMYLLTGGRAASLLRFVGAGTVIDAFFMGPLIEFFRRTAAIPFLEGFSKTAAGGRERRRQNRENK